MGFFISLVFKVLGMKKIILVIYLLSISNAFAQPAKDSALARDHVQVIENLKLMFYLDDEATRYLALDIPAKNAGDKDFPNYFRTILKRSSFLESKVLAFLGYNKASLPKDGFEFANTISNKNATALLSIIESYGYPSFKRIKQYTDEKLNAAGTFIVKSPHSYRKNFKSKLKQEYKFKNLSESEYEVYMVFVNQPMYMTGDEVIRMQKKLDKIEKKRKVKANKKNNNKNFYN